MAPLRGCQKVYLVVKKQKHPSLPSSISDNFLILLPLPVRAHLSPRTSPWGGRKGIKKRGKKGHGFQMAPAKFLDCRRLALRGLGTMGSTTLH